MVFCFKQTKNNYPQCSPLFFYLCYNYDTYYYFKFMTNHIAPETRQFLERLLEETHGNKIPVALKEEMLADLNPRLENDLITSLIHALPHEYSDEFDRLMETNPEPQKVNEFFLSHIPNAKKVISSTLTEFYNLYLSAKK